MRVAILSALLVAASGGAEAAPTRDPVLKQVDLPHNYYWRELYLPQLTSGPSSVSFMPDGKSLVYAMAGSLWRQAIGADLATELTHPVAAYDHQPDVARNGRTAIFARYDGTAIELWRLDLATGREQQLTRGGGVNVEPRLSPDGRRVAWVSTEGTGHFNLMIADVSTDGIANARLLLGERKSKVDRYYYSAVDHALSPAWSSDGKRLFYVTNNEVAWGTGDIWSVAVENPADRRKVLSEETNWAARPEPSPDGNQILYSSYHGRQWKQLWVTTPDGQASLPLSFGEFDRWNARWAPDGTKIALISNERGNTRLVVRDFYGGGEVAVEPKRLATKSPRGRIDLDIRDKSAKSVSARVSIIASDGRAYAPSDAWMHADDGFDPKLQAQETHYFHCPGRCSVEVPLGSASIWVQQGLEHHPWRQKVDVAAASARSVAVSLEPIALPERFGKFVSADLHVHMNYGGHYRATPQTLAAQARAEDLDVVYNLIVNKEERVPDVAYFRPGPDPAGGNDVLLLHSQEYHTSYWGHMGLLGLTKNLLMPGFSAYQNSPLASPAPDNGVIADLASAQGALVGYVHPFDTVPDPVRDKRLTNALPADVVNGKVDYLEVVGFADHKATAEVWYKLLNLGFRIPAGAGTDAMTNYASLRGPVGMNRVYLDTGGELSEPAVKNALKSGRTFATNGPLLGLELGGKRPGATIAAGRGGKVPYRVALRSVVAIDHLELVANGRVVQAFDLGGDRTSFDATGEIALDGGGWLVLRAWNDGSDPEVLDIYPYATTSPVYVEGPRPDSRADAAYFAAWLDRTIADASAKDGYRTAKEKADILTSLTKARDRYRQLAK